jgi:hypothetical protein
MCGAEHYFGLLGLAPGADRRAIKAAYAARLKSTRPEDDPAAFQQLHAAYKQALALAGSSSPKRIEDSPETVQWLHTVHKPTVARVRSPVPEPKRIRVVPAGQDGSPGRTLSMPGQQRPEEPEPTACRLPALTRAQADEVANSLRMLDRVLRRPRLRDLASSYEFLAVSPNLLDDGFRWDLGQRVLQRIVAHESRFERLARRPERRLVPDRALSRLDIAFGWSIHPERYWNIVEPDTLDALMERLQPVGALRAASKPVGGRLTVARSQTAPWRWSSIALAQVLEGPVTLPLLVVLALLVLWQVPMRLFW